MWIKKVYTLCHLMLALSPSETSVQNSWLFIHLELAKNRLQLNLRDTQQIHGPNTWEENDNCKTPSERCQTLDTIQRHNQHWSSIDWSDAVSTRSEVSVGSCPAFPHHLETNCASFSWFGYSKKWIGDSPCMHMKVSVRQLQVAMQAAAVEPKMSLKCTGRR